MTAIVLRADARHLPLPDASVDLICTSPPYFGLRDYRDGDASLAGQIGSEATPAQYVAALLDCTREWVRVLKPSGSMFVNLGDKYSQRSATRPSSHQDGLFPNRPELRKDWKRDREAGLARMPYENITDPATGRYVPEKSLMGLPWRYALACIDDLGLILRAEIIWAKKNSLPESVTDRVRRAHEQVFHFTRQPRYYSAVDEIREPHTATMTGRDTSRWAAGPSGNREIGRGQFGQPVRDFATSPLGKLPGSVWEIASQPLTVPAHLGTDHFAAYPMELPRRIIAGWSPPGICTRCGEGRRPVVDRKPMPLAAKVLPHRSAAMLDGSRGDAGRNNSGQEFNRWRSANPEKITGYACACPQPDAPTRPALVVDPFGGTGTTSLVADALGRHGIGVDRSADYCRLARWRTTDPGERAKARQVPKPPPVMDGQEALFA